MTDLQVFVQSIIAYATIWQSVCVDKYRGGVTSDIPSVRAVAPRAAASGGLVGGGGTVGDVLSDDGAVSAGAARAADGAVPADRAAPAAADGAGAAEGAGSGAAGGGAGAERGAAAYDVFDDPRITAVGLFTEAHSGLAAKFSAQCAEHGLAPAEFEVLLRLSRSPGGALRMSDLAAQTSLTTSGITRLVDRLERSGLLCRRACPSDRRGLLAELTPSGRTRMAEVLPGHLELIDQWFVGLLEPAELTALLAALRKVRDAVRPGATAGVSVTPQG
jgi:MarR family transcriptional regulator, 2-MHQ and catechol-resistance regulon repressor